MTHKIIRKGQKYRTISKDDYYAKKTMTVTRVTGQTDDDIVTMTVT